MWPYINIDCIRIDILRKPLSTEAKLGLTVVFKGLLFTVISYAVILLYWMLINKLSTLRLVSNNPGQVNTMYLHLHFAFHIFKCSDDAS